MSKILKTLIFFTVTFLLTSCFSNFLSDSAPKFLKKTSTRDAIPRSEPLSKYGNGDKNRFYEVRGKRYRVMASGKSYDEKGTASWYGTKFHGRLTSNREIYNIYAMTAAHKTLPLPIYVKVTNLKNKKNVIVRVNDRGPFVDDRLIDLSYAAALKLDIVKSGTAPVRIETVTTNKISPTNDPNIESNSYIQVGAFEEKENAYDYLELLKDNRFKSAFVNKKYNWLNPFSPTYQVQIGPFGDKKDYNELILKLKKIGVYQTKIVRD